MINLKQLNLEQLKELKTSITNEIELREPKKEFVLCTHECKNSANYHQNKYKHWLKIITSVDNTKTNSYAFNGEFLSINIEHKLPENTIIAEFCGSGNIVEIYHIKSKDNIEKIFSCSARSMSNTIDELHEYMKNI